MTRKPLLALALGAGAILAAGGAVPAVAGAPAPSSPFAARWTPSTSTAASSSIVTLPTGDLVRVTRDAQGRLSLVPLGIWARQGVEKMVIGKAAYVVPRSIRPVFGSVLDPALFDANALAARGTGRTAVTITYASAGAATAVPGVVITSRSGTKGIGYVDASSSAALGKALAGSTAWHLFAHVTRVQVPAKPTANPSWPMVTLTIKVLDRHGNPTDAFVGYYNVNDPNRGVGATPTFHGTAKVSVAAGTYQLITSVDGGDGSFVMGTTPETSITGPREIVFDARKATATMRTSVDRPMTPLMADTTLLRSVGSPDSGFATFFWSVGGDASTVVRLTPTVGSLHGDQLLSRNVVGVNPDSVKRNYRVLTANAIVGRIPNGVIVRRNDRTNMTTFQNRFVGVKDYSSAMFARTIYTGNFGSGVGLPPGGSTLTEYVSAGAGISSEAELNQYFSFDPVFTLKGLFNSSTSAPRPGTVTSDVWGQAPLHQRFTPVTPQTLLKICPACLGADGSYRGFNVQAPPLSDRQHGGGIDFVDPDNFGSVTIKADNTVLYDGPGQLTGGSELPSRANPKVISMSASATRSGYPFPRTTKMTTAVSTKVSAGFPAPKDWLCNGTTCTVLPYLGLDYTATGLDSLNALPSGKRAISLDISQVGRATAQGITSVKAWVSYDGRTWTAAPVAGSGAARTINLTIPKAAPGKNTIGLKVSVTDAAGSTLTEQIDGAFGIAG